MQGSRKPRERGRGFLFKTGEGENKQQPLERGCKHCNEVTPVKSTPESILLPTSREGPPRHGKAKDVTDQYGLQQPDEMKCDWNPNSSKVQLGGLMKLEQA